MKPVQWYHAISFRRQILPHIGGKAFGLVSLGKAGLPVPEWFVVTSDFLASLLQQDPKIIRLLSSLDGSVKQSAELKSLIKKYKFNESTIELLGKNWKRLSKNGAIPLAVRSSVADEDSSEHSFAGQMDSYLNVKTFRDFLKALRHCWASFFNERAIAYRLENNLEMQGVQCAVVVQRMIKADVSGVLFTANVLTGARDETVINTAWGLGEGIVSGRLDTDSFILDSKGVCIEKKIVKKKEAVCYKDDGATLYAAVEKEKQTMATLNTASLMLLALFTKKIRKYFQKPVDVEFAFLGKRLYLLQARPVTTLKGQHNNFIVWDNSNIVESYSGVTTPLTFSFIKMVYESVYIQFCEVLGIDKLTIKKNRNVFPNMLGLIHGRVYYNLLNWYRLVSLLPGFSYNRRFMEEMMGLQKVRRHFKRETEKSVMRKYFYHLPRLFLVAFKMVLLQFALPKRIKRFFLKFYRTYNAYSAFDFSRMNEYELKLLSQDLREKILGHWKEPILNDLKTMIFYGILKSMSTAVPSLQTLYNDLLVGEGNIKSKKVITELFTLARDISADPAVKKMLSSGSAEKAYKLLTTRAECSVYYGRFKKYIKDYGVRSVEEMKLESIPVKNNPVFAMATIQNYLRTDTDAPDAQNMHQKELDMRRNAEHEVKKAFKGKRFLLLFSKYKLYNWVLRHARLGIRDRENQRFCRSEIYSVVRDIFMSIGMRWEKAGIIEKQRDIFYLSWDEIWAMVDGVAVSSELKAVIALRKREYKRYEKMDLPDYLETEGVVYSMENLERNADDDIPAAKALTGLGCSSGNATGIVRVVKKPDARLKLDGEIMVAKQTDPGWVILFPAISGLVVEKGSMLSHSAIVAREMGIPAVVGVRNACRLLKDGDKVRIDGKKGTVELL
ncbi:MAG: hypothetical protein JW904_14230 [Spirochaetales bacterium]|nr:hypothetical protein [Spirochaetales bacterium]